MDPESSVSMSLLLNQEVSCVITAMLQNFRWAMVPTRYTVRHFAASLLVPGNDTSLVNNKTN